MARGQVDGADALGRWVRHVKLRGPSSRGRDTERTHVGVRTRRKCQPKRAEETPRQGSAHATSSNSVKPGTQRCATRLSGGREGEWQCRGRHRARSVRFCARPCCRQCRASGAVQNVPSCMLTRGAQGKDQPRRGVCARPRGSRCMLQPPLARTHMLLHRLVWVARIAVTVLARGLRAVLLRILASISPFSLPLPPTPHPPNGAFTTSFPPAPGPCLTLPSPFPCARRPDVGSPSTKPWTPEPAKVVTRPSAMSRIEKLPCSAAATAAAQE